MLFAAPGMLDGRVTGDGMPQPRHQELIRFLNRIDADTPLALDCHLIVDNDGTHMATAASRVQAWHSGLRVTKPGSLCQTRASVSANAATTAAGGGHVASGATTSVGRLISARTPTTKNRFCVRRYSR